MIRYSACIHNNSCNLQHVSITIVAICNMSKLPLHRWYGVKVLQLDLLRLWRVCGVIWS